MITIAPEPADPAVTKDKKPVGTTEIAKDAPSDPQIVPNEPKLVLYTLEELRALYQIPRSEIIKDQDSEGVYTGTYDLGDLVELCQKDANLPVIHAILTKKYKEVERLDDRFGRGCWEGWNPIQVAVKSGQVRIVKYMLEQRCENIRNAMAQPWGVKLSKHEI